MHLCALSLHDALPILQRCGSRWRHAVTSHARSRTWIVRCDARLARWWPTRVTWESRPTPGTRQCRDSHVTLVGHHRRSEEHTSELQSHVNLVCRLLLE